MINGTVTYLTTILLEIFYLFIDAKTVSKIALQQLFLITKKHILVNEISNVPLHYLLALVFCVSLL